MPKTNLRKIPNFFKKGIDKRDIVCYNAVKNSS